MADSLYTCFNFNDFSNFYFTIFIFGFFNGIVYLQSSKLRNQYRKYSVFKRIFWSHEYKYEAIEQKQQQQQQQDNNNDNENDNENDQRYQNATSSSSYSYSSLNNNNNKNKNNK
ncbi:hypothetical protein PPL_03769 [Heterostelium album PN500]|uniref:Uncharacterized protein n=1 Tax=Heterostelium pallidum (strain ATCC 26659 / Pp 5 / PN500) TaxID=670386 RepID=D3B6M0_HETP5|nr:hypothetical protein PPL_03769 [Heterostelium album PN500]EFA82990.1 hypothetical protein PPL_03769 [Heterostelium album PN500]|eukprot:XP_020435107.1 hypothetical protein PPL_03769 [Heterostelium album PN500]